MSLNPLVARIARRAALLMLIFIAPALALPVNAVVETRPLDKVAVIVNDDVITEAEIAARVQLVVSNLKKANRGQLPPSSVLRKQVVDNMVLERIQEQRARQLGVKIDDDMLDQAFADLASRNKMSVSQFQSTLKRDGVDLGEFKNQLRTQTMIRQLVNREVNSRIQITEQDVDAYLLIREQQQNRGIEYNISHILLTTPENASQAEIGRIQQQAQNIYKQLAEGASFTTLAVAHSKDQYALEGGLIGWRAAGQLPELFVSVLRTLQPGEISKVLKSANGFHILKLNQKRGETKHSFKVTQTHARHILMKRQSGITDDYIRLRLSQLRNRILSGEDFGKLARAHSDDVASAINNGDLDWITPGTMVPSFEQAMDRLKPGEISPIVVSPYGYHIIQVLGRRQKDLGKEKLRADARRELHVRKAEEYYQAWIRRLRDQAYVEFLG